MDDFALLSEEDKQNGAYVVCVFGTTVSGLLVGAYSRSPFNMLLLGGAGLALGLKACKLPIVQDALRTKISSSNSKLTDNEILTALRAIRQEHPGISKSDAMGILAEVRTNGLWGKKFCQA